MVGEFKIETPEDVFIAAFICLRSKMYALKCGTDSKYNYKGFCKSQLKELKFEEYRNCSDGSDYQKECDKFVIRSINHDLYLQKLYKTTLSVSDEKGFYKHNIEIMRWE